MLVGGKRRMVKIFIDDFGVFLGKKRNRFMVKKNGSKNEFLADDVESIVLMNPGITISTGALRLAIERKVQVVFARYGGWPYAVLMPTSLTGSVKARREQFTAYNDDRGFLLARGFVLGKLINQSNLLKLMAKNRKLTNPQLADKLYRAGRAVEEVAGRVLTEKSSLIDEKRQALMNLEAEGARIYWEAIRQVIPKGFGFQGRETRGAKDPFNIMLNYGYQKVLFPEVWKAVSYVGLDMYAGYLHADRPGKPSLVLDLMEEFRQQVVDRAVLSLVTKGVVKPEEVLTLEGGKTLLSKTVAKHLLEALQGRLETSVMFLGRKAPIKNFIHLQARQVVHSLLREKDYVPFTLGW